MIRTEFTDIFGVDYPILCGDAQGRHVDMIAAFCYSTGFLQEAVREQGLRPLEEAVHKLTAAPARLSGVRDCAVIHEGAHADVVIFDTATVGATEAGTRFDLSAARSDMSAWRSL